MDIISVQRRLIGLLPFLVLCSMTAYTVYFILDQNTVPLLRHISGFVLIAANAILYFFSFRYGRRFTGIILILATFNLAAFSPEIQWDSFGLRFGNFMLSTPGIQWQSFALLLFYLLANSRSIRRHFQNREIIRALYLEKIIDDTFYVAILNGADCKTMKSFLKEIGLAFRFPPRYGQNMHALQDCLNDLQWIKKPNYLLFIKNSEQFLKKESADTTTEICGFLKTSCDEWATVRNGNAEDSYGKKVVF